MHPDLFQTTSKIVAYSRSGLIESARKLFDAMSHRDRVAWNAMITGYTQCGFHEEALFLFRRMRLGGTRPDHFSFTSTLSACSGAYELGFGRKVHALVIVTGYQSFLPVNNSLIDMYGKCCSPFDATKVFEEMSRRNEISWCSILHAHMNSSDFDTARQVFDIMPKRVEIAWNIMIAGHARDGEIVCSLNLFKDMQEASCQPDQWTYSALMNACAESSDFLYGRVVHAIIIKSGWIAATESKNSVLSFYAKLGCQEDVVKVVESIGSPSHVSWNVMVDAYMKLGETHKALLAFDQLPEKTAVSWTSMIAGYVRNGNGEEAVNFFTYMMRNGLKADDFTFGAVLHACSSLAILTHGKMVHGCIVRNGFLSCVYVGNGLVNMYAKCGDLESSSQAFNDIVHKDLVSWNAMLFGLGLHGKANQALRLYDEMVTSEVKPDKVTFVGLLMTCSHSGLTKESRMFFESMKSVHGLAHEADHLACMVDMLGRGGYLAEAKELVSEFSRTENVDTNLVFEALLGACSSQGDVELGTYVGEALKVLSPEEEISYVLLSNMYCSTGQWKQAELIRKAMADQGVKKIPGCSWIEVGSKVITFVSGSHSHPDIKRLNMMLQILELEIRNPFPIGFQNW